MEKTPTFHVRYGIEIVCIVLLHANHTGILLAYLANFLASVHWKGKSWTGSGTVANSWLQIQMDCPIRSGAKNWGPYTDHIHVHTCYLTFDMAAMNLPLKDNLYKENNISAPKFSEVPLHACIHVLFSGI